jgi:hypothetical protein
MIELHILCRNENADVAKLRDLDLPTDHLEDVLEFRPLRVNVDHIVGFYPNTEGGCFIFITNGDELTVKESYAELVKLVCK